MAINAVDTSFTQFLNPNESKVYTIPAYQREYAWRQDHCEALINDIVENDINYFIGSVIWVEDTNMGTNEIIDGQQRLTSLNLLLIALYKKLDSFDATDDTVFKKQCIKRMLVTNGNDRLVPQRQGRNKEDFVHLINAEVLNHATVIPTNFGNRRISRNYNWFKKYISEYTLEQTEELYDKVCSLTFISVHVDTPQMAYTLFETMNNRGMDLSAIDLIKSTFLARTNNEQSITAWEDLISILGNESNQEQFLRNNYNAFRLEYNNISLPLGDNPTYPIAAKATRSNVIKIYNQLVEREDFIDFIILNANNNSLLTGEDSPRIDAPNGFKEAFKRFRNASATSAFTLLLFLLRNQTPFRFTNEQMLNLFELTLRFFARRNLTNVPSTGALPQILMGIIERINQLESITFDEVRAIMLETYISKTSSNNTVIEVLNGDIYETNRDMARYLLCSLCRINSSNERRMIDLWEKNSDDKYVWTIEHILPEGNREASNTPTCWIEMIRAGDNAYANYSNEQIIELVKANRHKIGNLTMTGYNSSLGNKSFGEKKNRFDSQNNPIGYNNGLNLNDYVNDQTSWTIFNISERTQSLVEQIMATLQLE